MIHIFFRQQLVGRLNQMLEFSYDPSWLNRKNSFPISLSLPLREDKFTGDTVYNVLSNLLPDDENVRIKLAHRIGAKGKDVYNLLMELGKDCIGAFQFLPEGKYPEKSGKITGHPINEAEIGKLLRDLPNTPLGLDHDPDFRLSIAGAQDKIGLLFYNNQWLIPHGLTPATHILKPNIGRHNNLDLSNTVDNEHFCLTFLKMLGLPVAKTTIHNFDGIDSLVIERFDRQWQGKKLLRLPQEDCCQALNVPPEHKYEKDGGPGIADILTLLSASDNSENDKKLFFTAQILYWLLGATDGHAKNFSIHLSPSGFYLTPFYDVVSLQPNVDAGQMQWNKMKIAMAVGKKRHYIIKDILPKHFVETAMQCRLASAVIKRIFYTLFDKIPEALEKTQQSMPVNFPKKIADSISNGVRNRHDYLRIYLETTQD